VAMEGLSEMAETVPVGLNEYRCGQFELIESSFDGYAVPRGMWNAVLTADAAFEEAKREREAATLAVVRYVAERHPDDDEFAEWARLGEGSFQ
jgi:hypothetical protein